MRYYTAPAITTPESAPGENDWSITIGMYVDGVLVECQAKPMGARFHYHEASQTVAIAMPYSRTRLHDVQIQEGKAGRRANGQIAMGGPLTLGEALVSTLRDGASGALVTDGDADAPEDGVCVDVLMYAGAFKARHGRVVGKRSGAILVYKRAEIITSSWTAPCPSWTEVDLETIQRDYPDWSL